MEGFRLNSFAGGFLSLALGLVPSLDWLELVNTWTGTLLNIASLASVLVILILNLKKLRKNAAPTS